ncbi:MAG: tRNA (adenine-N1)-methyltransferase [Euryarchaeota archaeon CG_4_9_14_3_um_filter_38_12]|nr:MAG: tRNA (adenine-N1)-methyltransferase [Euryarchaeota archaeon CG_4_9_14_3_um_filter_38_12]
MINENDTVVLIDEKGRKTLVRIGEGIKKVRRLGVFDPGKLKEKKIGEKTRIGNREFIIMRPSVVDKIETIERKAQIILPKDSALIILYCDVKNGDTIIEAGAGSGALTIALANCVRPDGKIISYEKRKDFAEIAKRNIDNAQLGEYVEIKIGDVTESIDEKDADAVILDIPNPWDAVKNACSSLKTGGHFCSYSPTMNQVEKTVKTLRKNNFIGIKTFETLQREIIVGEGGVRPSFDMLGHTGYVTFARKILCVNSATEGFSVEILR